MSSGRAIARPTRMACCPQSATPSMWLARPGATWTNTIGAPELIAVWADPEFDPGQKAFYYARVIEIPTPRWTAYDAKRFAIRMPAEIPMKTQDRAYTSPIWYTPKF